MWCHYVAKIVALALLLIGLSSCADSNLEDYSDFEVYAKQDKLNNEIDCDALASATMERKFGAKSYSVDLLDYLVTKGVAFKQCGNEIEQMRGDYCRGRVEYAVRTATNDVIGDTPGRKFFTLCMNEFYSGLDRVNDKYELPKESSYFLTLRKEGIMIKPSAINSISFKEIVLGHLWEIVLFTNDDHYALHFSDENVWNAAKEDLANIATDKKL